MIIFNKNTNKEVLDYSSEPVFHLIRIHYLTDEKNWINILSSAYLIIKISILDESNQEVASNQDTLSLNGLISPMHRQPDFEVNRSFKFDSVCRDYTNYTKWRIEIQINNLVFKAKDVLSIEYMDSNTVESRVKDWEDRISDLINDINIWSKDKNIEIKAARSVKMYEDLMRDFKVSPREIKTIDIYKNGKLVIALKPYGLWVLGANGRIDLLTAKGNYILVDVADAFKAPNWKLYLNKKISQSVDFNKATFNQLIEA